MVGCGWFVADGVQLFWSPIIFIVIIYIDELLIYIYEEEIVAEKKVLWDLKFVEVGDLGLSKP